MIICGERERKTEKFSLPCLLGCFHHHLLPSSAAAFIFGFFWSIVSTRALDLSLLRVKQRRNRIFIFVKGKSRDIAESLKLRIYSSELWE